MKPNLTKTQAKRWLKAVKDMEAYYRGEHDDYKYHCPFCDIASKGNKEGSCNNCVWVIFEGDDCGHYRRFEFTKTVHWYRAYRPEDWVTDSLKRLARWEKRLNKIIKEE